MIRNWLLRIPVFATLLVLGSSVALALTVYHYSWTSGGLKFACLPTANKVVYQCVSPMGHVVYVNAEQVKVTGDTEQGCKPNPHYLTVIRNPETTCLVDLNANAEEVLSQVADTMTEEQFTTWQNQEGLWWEYEWAFETEEAMSLVTVPCEDGASEGETDWSELVYNLRK